jgi:polynucleotide 5'-hydroxyl-kinase GRC3/NOL9
LLGIVTHTDLHVQSLKFPVIGSYSIAAEKKGGDATISGLSLGSPVAIHAPLCYSVPAIRCSGEVTVRLQPVESSPRVLGELTPTFRGIWLGQDGFHIGFPSERFPKKAPLQPLVVPPEWHRKISEMQLMRKDEPMKVLVCGPKSSGKSTFSRVFGNKLLSFSQVALLDLDPGQPEFAPPGVLSLVILRRPNLSPPFAHPWADGQSATMVRCHALASVTPADNPNLYMDIAINLHELYREGYGHLPLIVNTPGWILGTGLELLTGLISAFRPAEVIYMSKTGPEDSLDRLRSTSSGIGRQLSFLPSRPSGASPRTAAQLREMHTMSYFHYIKREESYAWSDQPLSHIRPLQVAYEGKKQGITAIISYISQASGAGLCHAIKGMLLALVEIEDTRAFKVREDRAVDGTSSSEDEEHGDDMEALVSRTPEGIPHMEISSLDPAFSHLLGLVLVRGVDEDKKRLHILTPIPALTMNEARRKGQHLVLVRGKFDPPMWAYTEDAHAAAFRKRNAEVDDDDEENGEAEGPGRLPFLDVLEASEKRPTGSQALRIRRDLK